MSGNFTNSCIAPQLDPSPRFVASAVIYGLVLAIGLPLNTLSLWILLRSHGLRSPCAVLMVNLAVSDLLLALSLPLRVYFYATLRWPFGATTCTAAITLFRINIRSSSVFITLISVDRMVALVFPVRSRSLRTTAWALKCCAFLWTIIIALCIFESVKFQKSLYPCGYASCFEYQSQAKGSKVSAFVQAAILLILLVVNIASTVAVIFVLQKRPSADASKVKNKLNVVVIFVVNTLVFIIFFLPFTLQLLTFQGDSEEEIENKRIRNLRALICLASVNCCLDPLIYYFSLDSFWQDKGKKQTDVGTYSLSRSNERT